MAKIKRNNVKTISNREAKKLLDDIFRTLAIDVGNTFIHFAIFRERGHVAWQASVKTVQKPADLKKEISSALLAVHKAYPTLRLVGICSVVPSVTTVLEALIKKILAVNPTVIGRDVIVPIKNLYSNPKQVGQDRLVGAYSATIADNTPAIVIDLGTAITVDVITARKEYLGGIIIPGINMTAETLFERTALLPLVEISKPKNLIGKDTAESILSGMFYGYGEMLKGLIELITKENFKKPPYPLVIMTGGHAELMAKYVGKRVDWVDPNLILKGISLLAIKN